MLGIYIKVHSVRGSVVLSIEGASEQIGAEIITALPDHLELSRLCSPLIVLIVDSGKVHGVVAHLKHAVILVILHSL